MSKVAPWPAKRSRYAQLRWLLLRFHRFAVAVVVVVVRWYRTQWLFDLSVQLMVNTPVWTRDSVYSFYSVHMRVTQHVPWQCTQPLSANLRFPSVSEISVNCKSWSDHSFTNFFMCFIQGSHIHFNTIVGFYVRSSFKPSYLIHYYDWSFILKLMIWWTDECQLKIILLRVPCP
jgi:hypothetical protein